MCDFRMGFSDQELQIILKEWDHCHDQISQLREVIVKIRSWSIGVVSAALGLTFHQELPIIILFSMIPIFLLWIFDFLYHRFLRIYIARYSEIEKILSSQMKDIYSPSISDKFKTLSKGMEGLFGMMFNIVPLFLYVSCIVMCFLSFIIISHIQF